MFQILGGNLVPERSSLYYKGEMFKDGVCFFSLGSWHVDLVLCVGALLAHAS